jgi:hypothetical protein
MRQAATIAVAAAVLALAPPASADTVFTEQPGLTQAAAAIPGQMTETGAPGPARVFCWNAEAWNAGGWEGVVDGCYDGFSNLPARVCRPLLRSLSGWQPQLVDRRFALGYAAFVLAHEAAHAAGADHENRDGTPSADCVAASHIRAVLRRLGQSRRQARSIERVLIGSGLGYEPSETDGCWAPL